jgi:molybdopterin-guanine dinucleotide biosynthesis protein A
MGTDKAAVRVGGMMMLERVVRAAMGAGLEVMVVGRDAAPPEWPGELRVAWLADEGPAHSGPAAGLVRALEHAGEAVVLLGCDLPLLTAEAIRALVAAHEGAPAGTVATVAVSAGEVGEGGDVHFAEPTFSVYAPGFLGSAQKILSGERRGFQWLLGEADVFAWHIPPEFANQVLNVNDAETLKRAERAAAARGD